MCKIYAGFSIVSINFGAFMVAASLEHVPHLCVDAYYLKNVQLMGQLIDLGLLVISRFIAKSDPGCNELRPVAR